MRSELRQHSQDEWAIEALYSYLCEVNRHIAQNMLYPPSPYEYARERGFSPDEREEFFALIETAQEAQLTAPIPTHHGWSAFIWVG